MSHGNGSDGSSDNDAMSDGDGMSDDGGGKFDCNETVLRFIPLLIFPLDIPSLVYSHEQSLVFK